MKNVFKPFMVAAAFAGLMTVNSCSKTCEEGYEGSDCKTEVRTKYLGTYTANGTDNSGGTYTGWSIRVDSTTTSVLGLQLTLVNGGISLSATMASSGGSFNIGSQQSAGSTYTGSGTLTGTQLTLTLNEVDGSTTTVYNFSGTKN